jgi:antitoxin CcdA
MIHDKPSTQRKPINLSLDTEIIEEAKALGINMSRSAETGIAQAIVDEKSRLWLLENADALKSSNEYVKRNGLPLAKYRVF